jgi:hypothetical protein
VSTRSWLSPTSLVVDRFADGDVTRLFRTGDELRVDPATGIVEILNRGE